MTMHPQVCYVIPAETERVARAALPKGSLIMRIRDELGMLFADTDFTALFPQVGQQLAISPSRLMLVTLFQFLEGLGDRQAADAVRRCIDWKYALALELTDPGFHFSVLQEFRDRLLEADQGHALLNHFLATCRDCGFVKARGGQRTMPRTCWRPSAHSIGWNVWVKPWPRRSISCCGMRHSGHAPSSHLPGGIVTDLVLTSFGFQTRSLNVKLWRWRSVLTGGNW